MNNPIGYAFLKNNSEQNLSNRIVIRRYFEFQILNLIYATNFYIPPDVYRCLLSFIWNENYWKMLGKRVTFRFGFRKNDSSELPP